MLPLNTNCDNLFLATPEEINFLFERGRHLTTDAEWKNKIVVNDEDAGELPIGISVQLGVKDDNFKPIAVVVFWNKEYRFPTENPLNDLPKHHPYYRLPLYIVGAEEEDFENGVLQLVNFAKEKYTLTNYYSPTDLELCIGKKLMQEYLLSNKIDKKRNVFGRFRINKGKFKILDRIGMFNSALEDAIKGVGLDPIGKDLVDLWNKRYNEKNIKASMDIPATHNPNEFIRYALGDVVDLDWAINKKTELFNKVIQEVFGFDPGFTVETIPNTAGNLTWTIFRKFIVEKYPKLYQKSIEFTDSLVPGEAEKVFILRYTKLEHYDNKFKTYNRNNQFVHGLGMCSIPNFSVLCKNNDTGIYGAVVHGGRCVNEAWNQNQFSMRIENPLDVDLSSCYATAAEKEYFVFGKPSIVSCSSTSPPPTLNEVLKNYGHDLVPGLWVAYLEGYLKYEQDLIVSKYGLARSSSIIKKIINNDGKQDELDDAHIKGDFELTTQQIELGVLTSESLNVLRKVASNKEWEEIKELKVATLIYFPASKELSHEEFVRQDADFYPRKRKNTSRYWTRIPLSEFISPIKTKRGEFKKLEKAAKSDGREDEAAFYKAFQTNLKLIGNTVYGCLASPYFPMGNTVVANNITDKARVGAWMMSKALQTVQSITDGGACSANEVSYLVPEKKENKKPGLHALARRDRLRAHRCIETKPLFPELKTSLKEWLLAGSDKPNKERVDELNKRVMEHINKFWAPYGLELPFAIEVKEDNTADYMVYRAKADYLLVNPINPQHEITLPNGEKLKYTAKVRGAKEQTHPSVQHLLYLAKPDQLSFDNCVSVEKEIVGVSEYQKANNPNDPFTPGSVRYKLKTYIPNNYKGVVCKNYKELQKLEKGAEQKKQRWKESVLTTELARQLIKEYVENGHTITKVAPPEPYSPKTLVK